MSTRLRSFLSTGVLGGVKLGMSEQDVRRILGKPELAGLTDERTILWKYGAAEITFYDGEVSAIGLYLGRHSRLPSLLRIEGYAPSSSTTIDEFLSYAVSEGLECYEDEKLSGDRYPGSILRVGAGISACFYGDLPLFDHFYFTGFMPPRERLRLLSGPIQ